MDIILKRENLYCEPLKIKNEKVFFVSDLHEGHDKEFLWGKRGFKSVEDHNISLVRTWNNRVDYNSIVFALGDICFGYGAEERLIRLLNVLQYKVLFLLPGNHYAGFKQLVAKAEIVDGILRYVVNSEKIVYLLPNYFEVIVNNQSIVLSHYPLLSYNGLSKGSYNLFGHCHNTLKNSEIGRMYLKYKVLDTGIEGIGGPISFEEVKKFMDQKELISAPDHHTKETKNPF